MALTQTDKKWFKDSMMDLLTEFHDEVARPHMEGMIKESEERVKEELGAKMDAIDLRLTKIIDHHSEKLDNHERRLGQIEEAVSLAG